jgi:hypothetical protein
VALLSQIVVPGVHNLGLSHSQPAVSSAASDPLSREFALGIEGWTVRPARTSQTGSRVCVRRPRPGKRARSTHDCDLTGLYPSFMNASRRRIGSDTEQKMRT